MRPNKAERKVQDALERSGVIDVLQWAQKNVTVPLLALAKRLESGVTAIDLRRHLADSARERGGYTEFVRSEAVRALYDYWSLDWCAFSQRGAWASAYAMWAGLIEPTHAEAGLEVWRRLEKIQEEHPNWRPANGDDALLQLAFEGLTFEPTEGARKLAAVVRKMNRVAKRKNRPFSLHRAFENLRALPPGFTWLYALYALDGQVCNGGFEQYFDSTGGLPTPFAREALRRMGADELIEIVMNAEDVRTTGGFQELERAYYRWQSAQGPHWLERSMAELVMRYPEEFG